MRQRQGERDRDRDRQRETDRDRDRDRQRERDRGSGVWRHTQGWFKADSASDLSDGSTFNKLDTNDLAPSEMVSQAS
jgi:hypothetical protein